MRCLVTGAQGFLGARVVLALRSAGAVVTATGRRGAADVVVCDMSMASDVARLVKDLMPDCIVHCAANVPKNSEEYQDRRSAAASLQMLDALLLASACPIVFISSMTVYGTERNRPVVEEDAGDPTTAYGHGKWQAEQRLRAGDCPALAVRLPGLFGSPRREGLVFGLLHALKYDYSPRLPDVPILWAAMHVNDAAASIAKLVVSGIHGFDAINLAYSGVYSIEKLVATAGDIFGRHVEYAVNQPRFEFDLTRAMIRGVVPDGSLRDALVKFGGEI